ncbi:MAG: hypothetical protein QNL51_00285 [Opitutaceae bacterium]
MKSLFTSILILATASLANAAAAEATLVPVTDFQVPDDLEVTVWATSPMLFNPTNMDTDAQGRIWVAEGVNYRKTTSRIAGDRIVVLEDTNHDGKADSAHVFVQDPELVAPLGISVFDNKIVVAQPPHILVYTDVDRDLKFDPAIDTREKLLSGFNGKNHDHSLHATLSGPDGKWYFNQGNCGAQITDKDGRTFQSGGPYYQKGGGTPEWFNDTRSYAGKASDDGNTYHGGFAGRMNPDGSAVQIVGHGFRNSYELCLSSFGDIFQNDNDDPPACRNTWLMEGGNLGFFSNDGTRTWQADRRPGQPISIAHWRQEDPGTLPAGDIYGAGSPTGMAFYEHGALPKQYEGMLLSGEARARIIQRYHPKLSATNAAVELGQRSNLLTCDENNLFRPSDIMVGADGALYFADWFDSGVGGHNAGDTGHSGTIYRLAPKGFKPSLPDPSTDPLEDALTLLKSPATNVRFTGFERLKEAGDHSLLAVRKILEGNNSWHAARAVWLLPHLGEEGLALCRARLSNSDPEQRLLAFRALRSVGHDVIAMGKQLANDPSPAVRRELAVALRDLDPKTKLPLVIELFSRYDGVDRHYLEACGLAAEDIESTVWAALASGGDEAPTDWSPAKVRTAWRLQPEAAVPDLIARAKSDRLSPADRKLAMETLAFIGNKPAVNAIADLAASKDDLGQNATWWLLNRGLDDWAECGTRAILKERGIYDPETIAIQSITVPEPSKTTLPSPKEIAALDGDPVSGGLQAARCIMCHNINGRGVDYGPALSGWVANQGEEAFYEAVIFPSKSIAHGYTASQIELKDGGLIDGLVYGERDPVLIQSTGGILQMVPRDRIKTIKKRRETSLMFSADQLGFTGQQLADLAAYMKSQ